MQVCASMLLPKRRWLKHVKVGYGTSSSSDLFSFLRITALCVSVWLNDFQPIISFRIVLLPYITGRDCGCVTGQ